MVTPASSAALRKRLLHYLLGFGELGLGVDAAHFVLAGLDHDGLHSQLSNDGYRVGQIILTLGGWHDRSFR